jgi:predicted kinase
MEATPARAVARPMKLVALAGLPGTGKSTLARALAAHLGAPLLDKDRVRAALFAPGEIEHSRRQDDLVVDCLYRVAAFHAERGAAAVVLDGRTFSRRDQIDALRAAARRMDAEVVLIECTAAPEVARARLERDRASGAHPASDRGPELYERLRASAERIEEPTLLLCTDEASPDELAARVLARIAAS